MGKRTALYEIHCKQGARVVDFHGWDMPLHYGSQLEEHLVVRRHCGMFDVSHMTTIDVEGAGATSYLRYLLANDVARLSPGQAQYSALLNVQGGVIDDLIVYCLSPTAYRLVANSATRVRVLQWLRQRAAGFDLQLAERTDLAIIAVQGPAAITTFQSTLSAAECLAIADLPAFGCRAINDRLFARTGYTGEEGLEVILPNSQAGPLWQRLSAAGITPVGLAARDTLRLEAGLNLYGHEMDETVSPLTANMGWIVAWDGERDFIGRDALRAELQSGVASKLVGLALHQGGVLRRGQRVKFAGNERYGEITSGTFSPTLGHSIALARVPLEAAREALAEVRGKWLSVLVGKPVFVRKGVAVFA